METTHKDKKQHIIESIVYGAMETGGFSLVVNADKLATYLLSLEERIEKRKTVYEKMENEIKGGTFIPKGQLFAPEKDDLETRFNLTFPEFSNVIRTGAGISQNEFYSTEFLRFIRAEKELSRKEGMTEQWKITNERMNKVQEEAKQAGRKEAAQEAVSLFKDEFASVLSVLEIREILKAYFCL